ncbi:nucleic acid-binding protein [Polychaeton citri CBS 116435]|uniref:Nucleic acid-binding protein n=1 Tax=Polychaeton citri CBS 116435 TaxID=1314669 RepID=A0A9P4QDH0_9PEZI|nr:nucleic acid-binding protein [Polychaeton citri CBS 116435]
MSHRAITLPIRSLSRQASQQQWVCRRCIATQAEVTPSGSGAAPPPPFDPIRKQQKILARPLAHAVPPQYLQHTTTDALNPREKAQRDHTEPHKEIVGVVVSAGKMDRTVKVRVPTRRWEPKIGKYYASHSSHLVHDPNNSLAAGDVIRMHRLRASKTVEHVVASIITPFGTPIEERNPIPTPEDRLADYKEKRFRKLLRRKLRVQAAAGDATAIQRLKAMGLDPGDGAEEDVGGKGKAERGAGRKRTPTKGAILGEKGQKLPKGVLPGGKHEVGKIDARAKKNKESAMKLNEKAEENLLQAREKGEQLRQKGLGTDSALENVYAQRGTSKHGNEG